MGLRLKASGAIGMDVGEVLRGWNILVRDGRRSCVELRALPSGRSVCIDPGQPDDCILHAVQSLPQDGQIYYTINHLKDGHQGSAKKDDIVERCWLLVDVDPVRPCDLNASAEEKSSALAAIRDVMSELGDANWPNPVLVDSGNGYHAYYRIKLRPDEEARKLVKGCLAALAYRYDTDAAKIDTKVCDAPRIAKLPGSWARKGPDSPTRPHRLCRVLEAPEVIECVTREQLEALAAEAPKLRSPEPPPPRAGLAGRMVLRASSGTSARALALGYVQRAAERVRISRSTDEGGTGRNDALNDAVFYCARFAGILTEEEILQPLREAAEAVRCPGVEATIRSAWAAGVSNPRGLWVPTPTPTPTPSPSRNGTTPHTVAQHAEPQWAVTIDDAVVRQGSAEEVLEGLGEDAGVACKRTRLFDIRTLGCLLATKYQQPRWVINGIMSEGLNLLVGSPKQGKSLLALNLALTIAGGGSALGEVKVEQADVLYLSLEDMHRRVQQRAMRMLKSMPDGLADKASSRLAICTDWPRQDDGGLRLIDLWLGRVHNPGLVIIDVWNRFSPAYDAKGSAYRQDADAVSEVKQFCDRKGIAGLVVHHDRKAHGGKPEEDFVASISGTQGIAGSADGIMVLVRARNEVTAELKITGRDVEERALSLEFDKETLSWRSLGGADRVRAGKVQTAVIEFLKRRSGYGASAPEIAEEVKLNPASVRQALNRMLTDRIVTRRGNVWLWPFDEQEVT